MRVYDFKNTLIGRITVDAKTESWLMPVFGRGVLGSLAAPHRVLHRLGNQHLLCLNSTEKGFTSWCLNHTIINPPFLTPQEEWLWQFQLSVTLPGDILLMACVVINHLQVSPSCLQGGGLIWPQVIPQGNKMVGWFRGLEICPISFLGFLSFSRSSFSLGTPHLRIICLPPCIWGLKQPLENTEGSLRSEGSALQHNSSSSFSPRSPGWVMGALYAIGKTTSPKQDTILASTWSHGQSNRHCGSTMGAPSMCGYLCQEGFPFLEAAGRRWLCLHKVY